MSSPKKIQNKKVRSRKLWYIIESLETGKHGHMLYWTDCGNKEFEIKFVHMNNPKWSMHFIELFIELDKLSKEKYEKFSQEEKYNSNCRHRCQSNLNKLVGKGALIPLGRKKERETERSKEENSIELWKFQINVNAIASSNLSSKGRNNTKKNSFVENPVKSSFCTENRNVSGTNVFLQISSPNLYERGKQMVQHNGIFYTRSIPNATMHSNGLQDEGMHDRRLAVQNMSWLENQNEIDLRNNASAFEGKFVFPEVNEPQIKKVGVRNPGMMDGTQTYAVLGHDELQLDNNPLYWLKRLPVCMLKSQNEIVLRNTNSVSEERIVSPEVNEPQIEDMHVSNRRMAVNVMHGTQTYAGLRCNELYYDGNPLYGSKGLPGETLPEPMLPEGQNEIVLRNINSVSEGKIVSPEVNEPQIEDGSVSNPGMAVNVMHGTQTYAGWGCNELHYDSNPLYGLKGLPKQNLPEPTLPEGQNEIVLRNTNSVSEISPGDNEFQIEDMHVDDLEMVDATPTSYAFWVRNKLQSNNNPFNGFKNEGLNDMAIDGSGSDAFSKDSRSEFYELKTSELLQRESDPFWSSTAVCGLSNKLCGWNDISYVEDLP